MRRLMIVISIIMLVLGCSNKNLTDQEDEEIQRIKNEAYTQYALKEKKSIDFAKNQDGIMKSEKEKIESLIKKFEEKITDDDFLEDLSEGVISYLESLKSLTQDKITELESLLDEKVEKLKSKYAVIQEEKELAKLEKENEQEEEKSSSQEDSYEEEASRDITPTYKNGILIVNKKHPLPSNFSPGEDPTAVGQLKKLINDMQSNGYDISNSYSGFRTYSHQKDLYQRYVNSDGQEAADTYSARPGHSEHQTGLTYDLLHSNGSLVEGQPEVSWVAENAARYGFIVRYQAGKESITGYQAEPWHLRYIGDEAQNIYQSGLTLEEYLGVEGGDYY